MPTYRNFSESGSVRIEVEETSGAPAGRAGSSYATELRSAIAAVVATISKQAAEKEDGAPSEISVAFALKALSGGGLAIALGDEQASFRIEMRWGGGEGGGSLLSGFPTG